MTGDLSWGQVRRGVVWHVLQAPALVAPAWAWCEDAAELVYEADGRPPRGARVCRKCCAAVADFAARVLHVEGDSLGRHDPAAQLVLPEVIPAPLGYGLDVAPPERAQLVDWCRRCGVVEPLPHTSPCTDVEPGVAP